MSSPLQPPAERLVALLLWLTQAVAARMRGGALPVPLINLITDRIGTLRQRFTRLAARIRAGTYRPRRPYTRRPSENPKPRTPSKLPTKFGWLLPLVPAVPEHRASAAATRYALEALLADPEMQALMQAAPAAMGRAIRPICWMLGLRRPDILAAPRRIPPTPRQPATRQARPAGSRPSEPSPARRAAPDPAQSPPAQACGPPRSG